MADYQVSRLNYQPQARPTNQFHRPEIRQGTEGSNLAQIAQGLAFLAPRVQDIYNQIRSEDTRQKIEAGRNFIVQKQIQNQKQFKQLVSEGKVPLAGNPWFIHGVDSTIAAVEVDKASRDLFSEYTTSGMMQEQDPAKVEAFVDDFFSNTLQYSGRSPDELRVISGQVLETKDKLLRQHTAYRSEQYLKDFAVAAELELGQIFDSISAQSLLPGHIQGSLNSAHLQRFMDEKSKYLPWSDLNDLVTSSALKYAKGRHDPSLFETVMRSVKTNGGKSTLYDNPSVRAAEADLFIEKMEYDKKVYEHDKWWKTQGREVVVTDFLTGISGKLAEARKTNPNATILDLGITSADIISMPGWDPETKEAVMATLSQWQKAIDGDKTAQEELVVKGIAADAIEKLRDWQAAHPGEYPSALLMDILHSAGQQGVSAEKTNLLQNLLYGAASRMHESKIDNAVYSSLKYKATVTKDLTPSEIHANNKLLTSQQIDDLYTNVEVNSRVKTDPVKGQDGLTARQSHIIETRVQEGLAQKLGHESFQVMKDTIGMERQVAQVEAAARQAATDYNRMFDSSSVKLKEQTYEAYAKLSDELSERAITGFGGLNQADYGAFLRPKEEASSGSSPAGNDSGGETSAEAEVEPAKKDATRSPDAAKVVGMTEPQARQMDEFLKLKTIDAGTPRDSRGRSEAFTDDVWRHRVILGASWTSPQSIGSTPRPTMARREQLLGWVKRPEWAAYAKETLKKAEKEATTLGGLTVDTKSNLLQVHNTLYELEVLTRSFGYSPAEVEAVPNGWQTMPLFANPTDLNTTDPERALAIGQMALKFKADPVKFVQTQKGLSWQVRMFRQLMMSP
jgi:hypothetical protein